MKPQNKEMYKDFVLIPFEDFYTLAKPPYKKSEVWFWLLGRATVKRPDWEKRGEISYRTKQLAGEWGWHPRQASKSP